MKYLTLFLMILLPLKGIGQIDLSQAGVTTSEEGPGVYRLLVAERVSVVAFTGPQGLMVIDAAYEQTTSQLMEALAKLSDHPVRYLVNTHIHGDHTGGNSVVGRDADIIAHTSVKQFLATERRQGDRVIPAFPTHALPNITFTDRLELDFNGQTLEMVHLAEGHTGGDIIVWFPESKVLAMGDLLFAGSFPFVDVANGGNPHGFLRNVEWIISHFPQDTRFIGGHGPVYSMDQLRRWHASLGETLEVVRSAKARGMSAGQMKQERILGQWEAFGEFFITEDRWIDTLYPVL